MHTLMICSRVRSAVKQSNALFIYSSVKRVPPLASEMLGENDLGNSKGIECSCIVLKVLHLRSDILPYEFVVVETDFFLPTE